jgi:hypothetical protein
VGADRGAGPGPRPRPPRPHVNAYHGDAFRPSSCIQSHKNHQYQGTGPLVIGTNRHPIRDYLRIDLPQPAKPTVNEQDPQPPTHAAAQLNDHVTAGQVQHGNGLAGACWRGADPCGARFTRSLATNRLGSRETYVDPTRCY